MYLANFNLDVESGIYLPKECRDFSYSDGDRIESEMLEILRKTTNVSIDSEELSSKCNNWPSTYHFGQGRGNVLDVLELPPDSKVLELGSGCGALSRYLAERCASVDCIEGSAIRAQIGKERCRNLENVRVYCSNFFDLSFKPEYDIVTLIGVWEYSSKYINMPKLQSYLEVLKLAKSALNDNGLLLIAIENKIGLKYWSGAPEDHSGKPFDGIHGYAEGKEIVTFSQKEIETFLQKSGFPSFTFYYCFPDYKFAQTIFSSLSDESKLFLHNWVDVPFTCPYIKRLYNFNEGLALQTLSKAGLLRQFANSFLIIASHKKQNCTQLNPTWVARKFSGYSRKKEHRCITELTNTPTPQIIKRPLGCQNRFFKNSLHSKHLKHHIKKTNWVPGDSLLFSLFSCLSTKKYMLHLNDFFKLYIKHTMNNFSLEKQDGQGYPLLHGAAFDFIPRNIIVNNDKYCFIDNEWEALIELPIDFLLYRVILHDIYEMVTPEFREKLGRKNKFTIAVICQLFSQYNKKRYKQNRQLGEELLIS